MSQAILLAALTGLLLVGSGTSELHPLVLDGHELHASLVTPQVDDIHHPYVPRAMLRTNPQLSTDADFMEAVSRGGSQGQLSSEGVQAALYALYHGETQLGFYGLEAASTADADRLEPLFREIWAHNASLQRARVHRGNKVLMVVWHDGVSADCWEAVNAVVAGAM